MFVEQLTEVHEIIDRVLNPPKNWVIDPSSKREVVFPRQLAHWICYYYTNNTIKDIAFYFGKRNHEMVCYSVLAVNNLIRVNYDIACKVRDVCLALPDRYRILYPKGRSVLSDNLHDKRYSIETVYAKPKHRAFKPKPVIVVDTPPVEIGYRHLGLKQLKELLEKETDIFVVMNLEREIDKRNRKRWGKHAVQHTEIFA
jgi:hypothetical protein